MYLLVVHVLSRTTVVAMSTPVAAEVGEQMALSIMLVDAEGMLVFGAPRARFWTRMHTSTAWVMVVTVAMIFNFVFGGAAHYFSC